ncbi:MAG: ATP-binding protein [Thermoguttaceae bacterium]
MGHAALFPNRVIPSDESPVVFGFSEDETNLFRRAADCCGEGILITAQPVDAGPPSLLYANAAMMAISGLSEDFWADASPPWPAFLQDHPLWRSLWESHHGDDVFTADVVVPCSEGSPVTLSLRSEPVRDSSGQISHRIATVRDTSRQTELEESARRNERLACVGLLASGVAHEINNPTGSALLAAETALTLLESPDSADQVAVCLRNIVASMDRCGRIVRTLLRYSREEPSEKQACSVNDVAKEVLEVAKPYAERNGARLTLETAPDVPLTPMNPLEIELVLFNLVRNAVEAGRGEGVFVSIRTEPTADGVRVAVCDNGCGMSQEQLKRVFDPFYTTRRQAGGSGLGMSIAYGIVQGHGGRMDVRSQPGQGATVTIELPMAPVLTATHDIFSTTKEESSCRKF